eukprot:2380627-Amphidinium_carterae.1
MASLVVAPHSASHSMLTGSSRLQMHVAYLCTTCLWCTCAASCGQRSLQDAANNSRHALLGRDLHARMKPRLNCLSLVGAMPCTSAPQMAQAVGPARATIEIRAPAAQPSSTASDVQACAMLL